eukprot:TRINITY_DN27164_c0_g1_i1.p1 TRINITY_DN27164_c0_g1~~TRINITY_DN27164_c0_g1_i1.p1  ORF type:complete len:152 (+),score=15.61 TRINITY_DN27164_c0_g1_i1:317-772(+)
MFSSGKLIEVIDVDVQIRLRECLLMALGVLIHAPPSILDQSIIKGLSDSIIDALPDVMIGEAFQKLLCDWRIWVYTSPDTQSALVDYLMSSSDHTKHVTVRTVLRNVCLCFWEQPQDYSCGQTIEDSESKKSCPRPEWKDLMTVRTLFYEP